MDYRLRRQVIAIIFFLFVGIIAIVCIANQRALRRFFSKNESVETSVVSTEDSAAKVEEVKRSELVGDDPMGWKQSPSFFDEDKQESVAEQISDEMRTLTLSVTSVCHDIRISIYGYGNVLHTGDELEVLLKNRDNPSDSNTYRDMDRDGIIYVSNLEATEYLVSLIPVEGFVVPQHSTRVKVKDKVDYVPVSDISLLIKEEKAVIASIEDTMESSASLYRSDTAIDTLDVKEHGVYGLTLSSKSEVVDFDALYEAGIRFVYLRAAYRGSRNGNIIADSEFDIYASMARRAGLEVGAYFYSQATNEVEAVEEASALLYLCDNQHLSYPMAMFCESGGISARAEKVDRECRTQICKAFMETLKSQGQETILYTSANWLLNELKAEELEKYGVWIADYQEIPEYEGVYDLWHYTDNGSVSGASGPVNITIDLRK